MKYLAKKPLCYDDAFWNAGSVLVDVEKNTADYMVSMGILAIADKDAEPTPKPDYGPARQSLESAAMEKAAAAIVTAVAGAAAKPAVKAV